MSEQMYILQSNSGYYFCQNGIGTTPLLRGARRYTADEAIGMCTPALRPDVIKEQDAPEFSRGAGFNVKFSERDLQLQQMTEAFERSQDDLVTVRAERDALLAALTPGNGMYQHWIDEDCFSDRDDAFVIVRLSMFERIAASIKRRADQFLSGEIAPNHRSGSS